jgi:hypothetical protein
VYSGTWPGSTERNHRSIQPRQQVFGPRSEPRALSMRSRSSTRSIETFRVKFLYYICATCWPPRMTHSDRWSIYDGDLQGPDRTGWHAPEPQGLKMRLYWSWNEVNLNILKQLSYSDEFLSLLHFCNTWKCCRTYNGISNHMLEISVCRACY